MADYSDIISQYGGTPADDYSDIISQYGGVPEKPSIFEMKGEGILPKPYGSASEALSGLMDIGAMIGAGGMVAGRQIAEKPIQPLVDVARGAVGLPIMAGQAALGDVAAQQQLRSLPANVLADYARAYGSPKAAFITAATEPGRFVTDISTLPALGSTAARVAGRALGEGAVAAQAGARNVIGRVLPISSDEAAIQNKLAALTGPAAPADIRAAYERGAALPRTPGMPAPSLAEATAAGGVELPGLAALEKSYGGVETPAGRAILERPQQQAAAIRDQLARVEATIQEKAGALSPAELNNPRIIRDVSLRNLAEERNALQSKLGALEKQLPPTSLYERGVSIKEAAEIGKEQAKKEVRTAFEKPFIGAAGKAQEDITPFAQRASTILSDTTAGFAPRTAPESLAAKIAALKPEEGPAVATFREIGDINKALNAELSATFRAAPNDTMANYRRGNLMSLKEKLNDIVDNSTSIPAEARTAWRDANKAFTEKMVKPYRTGVTADLMRTNIKNETVLPPDKTVEKYLSDGRNARQFVTTFGGNPAVMSDVNDAVLAMARKAAVKDGIVDPKALSTFAEQYREPLSIIGSDVNDIIDRVQSDAAKFQQGLSVLSEQAKALKKTDYKALVEDALKSSQEMSFLKERLRKSPAALIALSKEVTDNVLANVTAGEPKKALDMLNLRKRSIIGAVGKEQFDAMKALAEEHQQLKDISRTAPTTDAQLKADISGYSAAQKNDLKLAIADLERMQQMERLSAKAPSNLGERAGEEIGFQWYNPLSYPYNLIHATQRFLKKRQDARTATKLARDLFENPERVLKILESGSAKSTAPRAAKEPVRPAAIVGAVNVLSRGENRNAMSR